MFKSALNEGFGTFLLGSVLGVGLLALAGQPARAQMRPTSQSALSPAAQQMLSSVLRGLPPYYRQLVLRAISSLPPQRAEAELAELRSLPRDYVAVAGQVATLALQALPPASHQRFMNGLFGVSPADAQFANQVMAQVANTMSGISAMNQATAQSIFRSTMRVGQGWNYTLSGDYLYWPSPCPYCW
jgi:hypothetical protein